MRTLLYRVDRLLSRLSRRKVFSIALAGVGGIGVTDYLTGYEVSIDEFYLGPVALTAWYSGLLASIVIAILASAGWLLADISAGLLHSHPVILVWNTCARLGFFLISASLVSALRTSLSHQRRLARTDALTGMFTRRAFEERLAHDLDLASRMGKPLTLAFIDLDNFKLLNDTHGHNTGDPALQMTSSVLQHATRSSDTVARLGGDEFAIVFPDTDDSTAREVIFRIKRDFRQALDALAPELTCSIGVITFQSDPPSAIEAVRRADALMYDAKRKGKNTVTFSLNEDRAVLL